MRRGVDANVLVYTHLSSVPEHRKVRSFLENQLRNATLALVVTPQVLQEFVHIVTDARRFEELITCNASDFRVFEDLRLIDPLSG